MATSLLVIGYGNALRGDDGAGPRAAQRFGERSAAEHRDRALRALAVHQLLPELVDDLAQAARVVFIDAYPACNGNTANEAQEAQVARVASEPAAPLRIVPLLPASDAGGLTRAAHAASSAAPAQLLALCARLYRRVPRAWLVGIPAYDFAAGATISPRTAQRIEDAVEFCIAQGGR